MTSIDKKNIKTFPEHPPNIEFPYGNEVIDKIRTDTQSIMDSSNKLKYTKEKFEIDKESITNIIKESLSSVEHNETYSHMIRI